MKAFGSIRWHKWIGRRNCIGSSAFVRFRPTTTIHSPVPSISRRRCEPEAAGGTRAGSVRGGGEIERRAEVAGPGLRAPEERHADEAAHLQAVVVEQFDAALVGAAAVRIIDGAAGPGALALLVHPVQYRLPQQQLLAATRVGIVCIEPLRSIAADDPALVAVVGSARDLDDAVARLGEPATEDRRARRLLGRAGERAQGQ